MIRRIAFGVFLWTIGEYVVHRFVEHGSIVRAKYIENHLRHHREPWPAEHFVYSTTDSLEGLASFSNSLNCTNWMAGIGSKTSREQSRQEMQMLLPTG